MIKKTLSKNNIPSIQYAFHIINRRLHNNQILSYLWYEHGTALLIYALLSIALSWPTIRYFTSHIAGGGPDALHNLWIFWHTQQVVLGHQPPFSTTLLYYPHGASLLTHGLGPVTGIFALPFWLLGPEAAHNGAVLVSLWLTGYFMYLLARTLHFERGVAIFSGVVLMASPMCLAGLLGNITKVFLGGLPLVLLTLHHALNLRRSNWWVLTVALALLLLLLHSGYQFIFATICMVFFVVLCWFSVNSRERWDLFKRYVLLGISILLVVGPLLLATIIASKDPSIKVDLSQQSGLSIHQPDLIQFVLPDSRSFFFGSISQYIAERYENITFSSIDKAVSLSWTCMVLCVIAFFFKKTTARIWLLFTLICIVLAMGPFIRVFGQTDFTSHHQKIFLPYAFITSLPGFGFMRFPGRFMMIGYVGFGIAASFGLAWLMQQFPRYRQIVLLGAVTLVLIEQWPEPLYATKLPAVPPFYKDIAHDTEQYGVFDLPVNPIPELGSYVIPSSIYQIYQMTHHKGIAAGYLSRTYREHPLFPYLMRNSGDLGQANLFVNEQPASSVNALADLAHYNYRYVVWHKTHHSNDAVAYKSAQRFINQVFGEQEPLIDDDLTRVYPVVPLSQTRLETGRNWRMPEKTWRWVTSPATFHVISPRPQAALLQITPAAIYDPRADNGLGNRGVLSIQMDNSFMAAVDIAVDQRTTVPIVLSEGRNTVTLSLDAGNFQPSMYDSDDTAFLSFAIRSINLQTAEDAVFTTTVNREQPLAEAPLTAFYHTGWYDIEPSVALWASSPAELLVYSPALQQVDFTFTPALLYEPTSADGLGDQGMMQIAVNDQEWSSHPVHAGQSSSVTVELDAGWNTITLSLMSGNFRPVDIQPGNGDRRLLSFMLSGIEFT